MNNLETLIEKSERLTDFFRELQTSIKSESRQYVIKFEFGVGNNKVYSLYDNINSRLIKMDKLDRINSWFNIRNISEDKIKKNE
jgi:hypothetical protein